MRYIKPKPSARRSFLPLLRAEPFPLWVPKPCTCVGIAITQLIKPYSHIWKWLAVENTRAASKPGPEFYRQSGPEPFPPLHKTFLTNRTRLQTVCYTDLFPSSETLNGSPLKEVVSFCHMCRRFWFEGNMIEWFCYCVWEKNWTNFKVPFFSHNLVLGVYTQTPFVFFLYVTGREGEDETLLKEASVLISSEGSPLFFHPP